jgi:hypothetical protein
MKRNVFKKELDAKKKGNCITINLVIQSPLIEVIL